MRRLQIIWNAIFEWCSRACTYVATTIFGERTPQRTKTEPVHTHAPRIRNSRFQAAKCIVSDQILKEEIELPQSLRIPCEKQNLSTEISNLGDDFELL